MSINGVSNPLLANLGAIARPPAPGAATSIGVRPGQLGGVPMRPAPTQPARPTGPLKAQPSLAAPSQSLPSEAPAGTDPELWSVLTTEERAYFAKAAATGPLTYGRVAAGINAPTAQAAPASRGGRLDVRA